MKTIYGILVMALLVLSVMPMVMAEGDDDNTGINITVQPPANQCPIIYQDSTQRAWYPNDQTYKTATKYGTCPNTNLYGDPACTVGRGNYLFQGETLSYYMIVSDANGDSDINSIVLQGFGGCAAISPPSNDAAKTYTNNAYTTWDGYAVAKYGISAWDDSTMNLYRCILVVGNQTGEQTIKINTTDKVGCSDSETKESITFNPNATIELVGSINFGSVVPGSIATSIAPITLKNSGSNGVVMDMYIASSDYFRDTSNPSAICGIANGIKYDKFSYKAIIGPFNSGTNDNTNPGLGKSSGACSARADEFTVLPSNSGDIVDMCRIINYQKEASFVTAGSDMSLTFRVDVPTPCSGSFTQGKFYFVGRVV